MAARTLFYRLHANLRRFAILSFAACFALKALPSRRCARRWTRRSQAELQLYLVPDLALTVVIISATDTLYGRIGYVDALHRLMSDAIIPAAEATSG